ncbi:hypothetical protein [Halobaculum gomorrense]|uniref:Uncharacterized protein n=1 Tax=Halobaculum gomorrense TaxID=43928 RepID=A0A1M5P9S7_9EURY|nr:hypothetical protein [Halobaculum gomorrense]SHG98564.1 hypothetical protein SAMN05443636_1514 [Halobaculum gomorrense]
MRSRHVRLGAVASAVVFALAALPASAAAHPSHVASTPTGPLAGASPVGVGIGLAGLALVSGALLLAREGVLTERARSAGVGAGAALVIAGAAAAVLLA